MESKNVAVPEKKNKPLTKKVNDRAAVEGGKKKT